LQASAAHWGKARERANSINQRGFYEPEIHRRFLPVRGATRGRIRAKSAAIYQMDENSPLGKQVAAAFDTLDKQCK
jgi:hypothetical protein